MSIRSADPGPTFYLRSLADAKGSHWSLEDVHPADLDAARAGLEREKKGEPFDVEYRIRLADGSIRWKRHRGFPLPETASSARGIAGLCEDITHRKESERGSRENQALLLSTIESLPFDFFAVGKGGDYILANASCVSRYGNLVGRRPEELAVPEETKRLWLSNNSRAFSGETVKEEVRFAGGGEMRTYYNIISPIRVGDEISGILGINVDITELKRTQEELEKHRDHLQELVEERSRELELSRERMHRSERLASVGTLAAGLTHEINNPLTGILMSAQVALKSGGEHGNLEELLRNIITETKRCSEIVRAVLQFARQEPTKKQPTSVPALLRRVRDLAFRYAEGFSVVLTFESDAGDVDILANPTQIEQVLVNIIHNAVHASETGGQVRIRASAESRYVRIQVVDQGHGMTGEQKARAFDPFYTAQARHPGLGLGLSIAHGIVSEHNGTIEIHSKPGEGTRVEVALPRA